MAKKKTKEDYSVIRIEDLKFRESIRNILNKQAEKEKPKKTKLTSKEFEPEFKEVSEFLYSFLPLYLNIKFNVPYKDTGYLKKHIKSILKNVFTFLSSNKYLTSVMKESLTGLGKLDNVVQDYENIIKDLNKKYAKEELREDQKKAFQNFYALVNDKKGLNKKALSELDKLKVLLDNKDLFRLIHSIEIDEKISSQYDKISNVVQDETVKLFGKEDVNTETMAKVKEEKPEEFKKWRKLKNELSGIGKNLLLETWKAKGYKLESPETANKLLKSIKVESTIDSGFVGLVTPGDTNSIQFTYFTSRGIELVENPGRNVIMNENYDPETDNTYYSKGYPAAEQAKKEILSYTVDYTARKSDRLFLKALKLNEKIEDIRIQVREDILKEDLPVKKTCALVIAVIDATAGRIGSTKTEKNKPPTYGISTLKYEHLTIEDGDAILEYAGKDNQPQRHIISDSAIVEQLTKIKNNSVEGDYLFRSKEENRPYNNKTIGNYLKKIGWEDANPHTFRKYHANLIFSKIVHNTFETKEEALTAFNDTTIEISKKLGNTQSIAISAYTSPTMIKEFFDNNGFDYKKDKIPSIVLKTLRLAKKI